MVSFKEEGDLIYDVKLSSVGPGHANGLQDDVHNPSNLDLAMKLHYLTGVYIFRSSQTVEEITIMQIKEAMFYCLDEYHVVCGRFRRSDSDRPYLKCNDCGWRFVEAQCAKTVDELFDSGDYSYIHKKLVYHQPIGPELAFSPPVYVQVTKFKCGGMSMGFSWAHVLGDVFSANRIINRWAQILSNILAHGPLASNKLPLSVPSIKDNHNPQNPQPPALVAKPRDPLSFKRVDPVGDHWVTTNNCKMDSFSFHLKPGHISHILPTRTSEKIPTFESISAIVWQCVARIRDGVESNAVTICKRDKMVPYQKNGVSGNSTQTQIIISVKANFSVREAETEKLAKLMVNEGVDERFQIEEAMKKTNGTSDFVVYGAQLTFVNLEEADVYGLELSGKKPDFGCYGVQGVGDGGVVLVNAGPLGKDRFVTVILPEDQILKLKLELEKNGLLLESDLE